MRSCSINSILLWILFFLSAKVSAQIPVIVLNDDFSTPANWTVNFSGVLNFPGSSPQTEGSKSNQWKIGVPPQFPISGNSLYITCKTSDCLNFPARFRSIPDDSFATNVVARRNLLITPGSIAQPGDYKLKFQYLFPKNGLPTNSDGVKLVYWIPNSNGTMPSIGKEVNQQINTTSSIVNGFSIDINAQNFDPAIFQRGMYIGFRWFNRNPSTDDNSIIIDDLKIEKRPVLTLNSIDPSSVCAGDSVQFNITAGGFPSGTSLVAQLIGLNGAANLGQAGNGVFRYKLPPGVFGTFPVQVLATGNFPGEIASNSISITIEKKPSKPSAGVDAAICSGAPDGPVQIGSAGDPEFTYSWSENQLNAVSSNYSAEVPEPFITNNGNGPVEYSFIITATNPNNGNCQSRDTVKLKVFPNPRITVPLQPEEICNNATPPVPLNVIVEPNSASQPPLPSSATSSGVWTGSGVVLEGTQWKFNPSGLTGNVSLEYNHTIKWTINGPTCKFKEPPPQPQPNKKVFTILKAPEPNAGPPQIFCSNLPLDTIEGYSQIPGTTFIWSGAAVTPDGFFNPSNPNVVPPTGTATKTTICTLTVSKLFPGGTTCSARVLKDLIVKRPPAPPFVNAGPDETICSSVSELSLGGYSPIGSNGTQTKGLWIGPGISGGSASPNAPNPKFIPVPGQTSESNILTYTYTDADGCAGSDTKIVFVKPSPIADAGIDRNVCAGQPTIVGGSAQPKTKYKWIAPNAEWFFPDTLGSSRTLRIPNNSGADILVTAQLVVTDSISKCSATDAVIIKVRPIPTAAIKLPEDTTDCLGKTIRISASLPQSNPPLLDFQWFRDGFPITPIYADSSFYRATLTGKYKVAMSFRDLGCFDTSASVPLRFYPVVKPRIVGDTNFCGSSSTLLRAVPGNGLYSYEWKLLLPKKNGTGDSTVSVILPGTPIAALEIARNGKLTVNMLTDKGCQAQSDPVIIKQLAEPVVVTENRNAVICDNDGFKFSTLDSAAFKYRWLDSANRNIILSEVAEFEPKAAGTYYLEVYNKCGIASDTFRVFRINPAPQFGILTGGKSDTTVCIDQDFYLKAPTGFSARWKYYNFNIDSSVSSAGDMIGPLPTDKELPFSVVLNLQDKQGCSSIDSIQVQVIKCPAQIFVPNAFMPVISSLDANSPDSKVADNAVWFFDGYGLASARCYVYSRWGELVFTKEGWGRKNGWDGYFNNVLCPTGTYKYLIEFTGSNDNQLKRVTGNITLIR